MKLGISVYKPSGKWYASIGADVPEDCPLYSDRFDQWLFNNLPAKCLHGYVVVTALSDGDMFYEHLYKFDELVSKVVPY